jgi:hypothetical protein
MPPNVRFFAGFTSSLAFRSSAISIVRLKDFPTMPLQLGLSSFLEWSLRDCGCGKAMSFDDLFRKDRPNKMLPITPSRLVDAFTRTSGLGSAPHCPPLCGRWPGGVGLGSGHRHVHKFLRIRTWGTSRLSPGFFPSKRVCENAVSDLTTLQPCSPASRLEGGKPRM